MAKRMLAGMVFFALACSLTACGTGSGQNAESVDNGNSSYERVVSSNL